MSPSELNIVLVGMRGSGKTTVGAILAGRLHRELIPMDALIVYEFGLTVPEIVAAHGWARFREVEARVAREVARLKGTINATGGGVVLDPENVKALRETGIVFWLDVSVDQSLGRIGEDPNRPSLTGRASRRDDLQATHAEREPLYRAAAHHVVSTDGRTQEQVADEIARILRERHGVGGA
jgi:shikimate kinase